MSALTALLIILINSSYESSIFSNIIQECILRAHHTSCSPYPVLTSSPYSMLICSPYPCSPAHRTPCSPPHHIPCSPAHHTRAHLLTIPRDHLLTILCAHLLTILQSGIKVTLELARNQLPPVCTVLVPFRCFYIFEAAYFPSRWLLVLLFHRNLRLPLGLFSSR